MILILRFILWLGSLTGSRAIRDAERRARDARARRRE